MERAGLKAMTNGVLSVCSVLSVVLYSWLESFVTWDGAYPVNFLLDFSLVIPGS